ncbi:hypothetical protein BU24DRAFT_96902 [Aaosphaeria arxii CBS 175.79]|uniref:Uncharacterized protein n=1 Tax=Aaosphaeria arxii CBS 175.79 TaxID=1450172 RepID=A0A6A5X631_9PLEO|nr:uncharacterized protein BU24DRAFT_96902 [Aaosphaeria arxii CBS 175.79]KAF2008438.1 hypothetical protein BU24DRAFT_96902 [Aaosphaeria arxii CBS 175.79]
MQGMYDFSTVACICATYKPNEAASYPVSAIHMCNGRSLVIRVLSRALLDIQPLGLYATCCPNFFFLIATLVRQLYAHHS